MHGIQGEQTLMRIHIEAHATWHDMPLYEAIVRLLREHHFAGATVLRGLDQWSTWWHHLRHPHEDAHPEADASAEAALPFVIEAIESADKIEAILPLLDPMIGRGVITLERAYVILYRPHAVSDNSDTASTA